MRPEVATVGPGDRVSSLRLNAVVHVLRQRILLQLLDECDSGAFNLLSTREILWNYGRQLTVQDLLLFGPREATFALRLRFAGAQHLIQAEMHLSAGMDRCLITRIVGAHGWFDVICIPLIDRPVALVQDSFGW